MSKLLNYENSTQHYNYSLTLGYTAYGAIQPYPLGSSKIYFSLPEIINVIISGFILAIMLGDRNYILR